MRDEKRKQIIRALTNKPALTWNELMQETKLSKATLSRHLNRLISEGTVHKIPTVYSLSDRIEIIIPQEAQQVILVKDIKRVKSGKKGKNVKLIPLVAIEKGKTSHALKTQFY